MKFPVAILLVLLAFGLSSTDLMAQRRPVKPDPTKPLSERDPELASWIDTLMLNLQKDHREIRNSSAQALIAVGAEAVPYLQQLRETGDRPLRNLATRILERIARETGRNLFQDDIGGDRAESVAEHAARVLKLNEAQKASLVKTITFAQDEEQKIRAQIKDKRLEGGEAQRQRRNLQALVTADLKSYLDQYGTDFVLIRLGWGNGKALAEDGRIVDEREMQGDDAESQKRREAEKRRSERRGEQRGEQRDGEER